MTDERAGGADAELTEPDDETRRAEAAEAGKTHGTDRDPTAEEEAAADRIAGDAGGSAATVAQHEREMQQIGADTDGEGRPG